MEQNGPEQAGFFARWALAWRLLWSPELAERVQGGLRLMEEQKAKPAVPPAHQVHASALFLLSALQREGRLIDFLQQEVAGHSDSDVGAAARVIHGGCRKTLQQYFGLEPVLSEHEGDDVSIAKGFDAQRIQLTGNVAGQPPFRGILKHHGWVAKQIRLPSLSETLDPRVLAPAEVELA